MFYLNKKNSTMDYSCWTELSGMHSQWVECSCVVLQEERHSWLGLPGHTERKGANMMISGSGSAQWVVDQKMITAVRTGKVFGVLIPRGGCNLCYKEPTWKNICLNTNLPKGLSAYIFKLLVCLIQW